MTAETYDVHTPVLLEDVLGVLSPQREESYLDLTAGYGGHAQAVLARTEAPGQAVLVDRDATAIESLERAIPGAEIVRSDFLSASQSLASQGRSFDLILADLGVSSLHLNDAERGFSFAHDGPLDMRMDQRAELTADTVVNTYAVAELARVIREYGEEPRAMRVAERIVSARPIQSTAELAEVVAGALPRGSKKHPATKTFQAIRIAVNDELRQVAESLPLWLQLLKPGGRLAVISFHSLEDRIVKQAFASVSGDRYDAEYRSLTKRPLVASEDEIVHNPRARSAKLRAVAKINNKERG